MTAESMATPTVYATSFSFFSAVTRSRHDVFLSFRGEDTRYNITKQLHKALEDAGIPTFKDDVNLEKGGEIASELLNAIQMSRIAIVVFSRNYATSRWCLDELVKIIECKNEAGQVVLPIFYDVDPSDVLQQTNSYAQALDAHEERFRSGNVEENKVESWRSALTEAASSPNGWDMQKVESWHQSKFIKEIVKHILDRRQDAHMSASIFPTKVEAAKEYMNLLLSVISDDILVIGIWGTDRTAIANIARAVYNQNYTAFEASSFLSDVSRSAEQYDGLVGLQKQFVSDILMEDNIYNIDVDNVEAGTLMIRKSLSSKRVLVVLDNVNKLEQLNALARTRDWFSPGSRVILTTRDPQLLNVLEVDDIYGPQGIQVINDQFRKNLQTIDDMMKYISKFNDQSRQREMALEAEIERELKKNAIQAQILANLQPSSNDSAHPSVLPSPAEAPLSGNTTHEWESGLRMEINNELESTASGEFFSYRK